MCVHPRVHETCSLHRTLSLGVPMSFADCSPSRRRSGAMLSGLVHHKTLRVFCGKLWNQWYVEIGDIHSDPCRESPWWYWWRLFLILPYVSVTPYQNRKQTYYSGHIRYQEYIWIYHNIVDILNMLSYLPCISLHCNYLEDAPFPIAGSSSARQARSRRPSAATCGTWRDQRLGWKDQQERYASIPGWCFGTFFSIYWEEFIIQTDFHIFRRGRHTTNQIHFDRTSLR